VKALMMILEAALTIPLVHPFGSLEKEKILQNQDKCQGQDMFGGTPAASAGNSKEIL
jgi:hypothetical protein